MTVRKKTKSVDLVERINRLLGEESPSEFACASIIREAKQLKSTDPVAAYVALGMVACLQKDEKNLRKYHEKALLISDAPLTNLNYATSLTNFELYEDSIKYFVRAIQLSTDHINPVAQAGLIEVLATTNRFCGAYDELAKWKRLFPEKELEKTGLIEKLAGLFRKNGLDDDSNRDFRQIIQNFLKEKNQNVLGESFTLIQEEGDDAWLDLVFDLEAQPAKSIVDLNIEFSDYIVQKASPELLQTHSVRFQA